MLFRSGIIDNTTLLENRSEMITQQLDKWVNNKGYLIQGITINTLSSDLGINKTYLSSYINNELNITFREWVNNLRIEYAKIIMLNNPNKINDEIAEMSGYASRSHFIRVFTDVVGETPSNWKKNNINGFANSTNS